MAARKFTWRLLLPLILIAAAGMAGVYLFVHTHHVDRNAVNNTAARPLTDLRISKDIAFSSGKRGTLDVYAPSAPGNSRPVVVFIYGGSWASGSKADYAWVGAALARHGYVAVIPDYRVYPDGLWPTFLQDNARAVRWARDHAADYGGSPSKLVLLGHSAGAFNVVSLAVDARWLDAVGMVPDHDLAGVIGLSGPYIFDPDTPTLEAIFGPKSQWPDTQPINHIDGRSPPLLFITGDKDDAADPSDCEKLTAKIRSRGGVAATIHYPTYQHNDTLGDLARPGDQHSPVMRNISSFIEARRN